MAHKAFLAANQLDFDALKDNLKTFLQGQAQFQDYDFEGSNLSALLDLLTYNTYLNSLYLNQVGGEMFLDTALIRDSIVSHAKELNYVPSSMKSAVANVTFVVNTATTVASEVPPTVTIPQNFEISTTVGDNNYVFTTETAIVLSSVVEDSDGYFRFYANNVSVYEGEVVTETFVANTTAENESLGFTISSANVDTRSIVVNVQNSISDTANSTYEKKESLLGLSSADLAYFIEPAQDYKYKIVFGNGISGKSLLNGNIVKISYRNAHGEEPNGANSYTVSTTINNYSTTVVSNEKAQLGTLHESNESIKYNAPRYFATQGRAVTTSDYKSLIRSEFNQFQTVTVYGGDEETPAVYGKVIVVVKPSTGRNKLNDTEKNQIISFLRPRTPLSIDPIVKDAEFNKVRVTADIDYNLSATTQSANDIKSKVITAIRSYDTTNLGDFGSILRFSKLSSAIDECDASILGNELYLSLYKEITPSINIVRTITFEFENELDGDQDGGAISSSAFTYNGKSCTLRDNGQGVLEIITQQSGTTLTENSDAGTVNYTTGSVTISNFIVSAYAGSSIKINAVPLKRDVISTRNIILNIGTDEIYVNVTGIVQ